MKNLFFLTLCLLPIAGCGKKDKYDIDASDIKKQGGMARPSMIDANNITVPDGANVEEVTIRKGDKLPDGKIATEDTKIKTFSMPTGGNVEFKAAK